MHSYSKNSALKYEQIGSIDVDSGQIIISDPCYLFDGKGRAEQNAVSALKEHQLAGRTTTTTALPSFTVTNGFDGDGTYPVFAARNSHGVIQEIVIKFSRDPDYQADIEEELMLDAMSSLGMLNANGNLRDESLDEEE